MALPHKRSRHRRCHRGSGLQVSRTAANVIDMTQAGALLREQEMPAFGDAGYQGATSGSIVIPIGRSACQVAMGPSKHRALPGTRHGRIVNQIKMLKVGIRRKVVHPFHVVKWPFRSGNGHCRKMAGIKAQLWTLVGLANLLLAWRRLRVRWGTSVASGW